MFTILFVCTGNTCRSSMAHAIAKGIIQKRDAGKKVRVVSAGTSVIPDSKAAESAIAVMGERGLDLNKHTARQLTPELIEEADLVLTMTRNHKQHVLTMVPHAQDKVFTLKEYVRNQTSHAEVEDTIIELASKLDKKELKFYEENKAEINSLKEEQKQLKEKLQIVEKKIQDWHIRFHEYTKFEREALKKFEEQILDIDVCDPIGHPIKVYKECADEIECCLNIIIDDIINNIKA